MNNVPNSDSEQCIESDVQCAYPGPACAHCPVWQAWPDRVVGASCHVAAPTRSGAPCRGPCAAHRIVAQDAMLRASSVVSWCLPRPCRACLAIQPSGQAAPRYRPYRARANRVVAYFGRIVVAPACIARPYRGLVPLLSRNFFFSLSFLFHFVSPTGRPKKKNYIYIYIYINFFFILQ